MIFRQSTVTEEARSFAEAAIRELTELRKLALNYQNVAKAWSDIDVAAREGMPAVEAVAGQRNLVAVQNLAAVRNATDLDKLSGVKELASGAKLLLNGRIGQIAKTMKQVRDALKGAGLQEAPLLDDLTLPVQDSQWDNLEGKLASVFSDCPELPLRIFRNAGWPFPLANWEEMWLTEQKEIEALRLKRDPHLIHQDGLFGLALSGGGIRTATFNLGIIQGLANFGLLKKVDILSTVSGGGYIGSWLSAWIKREKIDTVQAELKRSGSLDLEKKESSNADERPVLLLRHDDDPVPKRPVPPGPIRFLRQFSNYLTPQLGFFSVDSWTVAAVFLRNVTLNQVTLASILGALMLLPRFAVWPLLHTADSTQTFGYNWLIVTAIILMAAAVALVGLNLKRVTADPSPQEPVRIRSGTEFKLYNALSSLGAAGVQASCVSLMIAGVTCASGWFWMNIQNLDFQGINFHLFWLGAFGVAFVLSLSITLGCRSFDCLRDRLKGWQRGAGWIALVLAMLTSSAVAVALLRGYLAILWNLHMTPESGPWHAVVWSPVLLMLVPATAAVLHIGLLGTYVKDIGREWLTRFRATTQLWLFFWVALCCAAIYGPLLFAWAGLKISGAFSIGWIVSTIVSLKAGGNAQPPKEGEGAKPGFSIKDLAGKIGPPIFMVGFLLFISLAEQLFLAYPKASDLSFTFENLVTNHWQWLYPNPMFWFQGSSWPLATPGSLFLMLTAIGLVLAWRVDINEFSMHHFYKNRLVRCYLGASNLKRDPNPFTGFDPEDDLSICELKASAGYTGPFHIINTTLNLSAGGDLAWQERKGASFTFTPSYCGFDLSLETETDGAKRQETRLTDRAYRDSRYYAYPKGVPLGTAVAISGAAADPNQGRGTSPTLAFLMTVFDVRLGWWLGNPRRNAESKLPGPRFGLMSLLSELLGRTDDRTRFVSLSDGGHFDNMGLYELVRRRCKYIILGDGEQDGSYKFEGLGMAIRKCRIDFGVQIDIDPRAIKPSGDPKLSEAHCAVGTIHYDAKTKGTLLYIKSSLTGNEPKDVLQYASTSPTFPHESTADQWFTESQFESYRALGYAAVNAAIAPAKMWTGAEGTSNVEKLFDGLASYWYPPNPAMRENAIKHTATLAQLLTRVGTEKNLDEIGRKLFSVNSEFAPGGARKPSDFFFVMVLLQLVEDIYFDFQLERPEWRKDPRIEGWRKLFTEWANAPVVHDVWQAKKATFRVDFQHFWESFRKKEEPDAPTEPQPHGHRTMAKGAGS